MVIALCFVIVWLGLLWFQVWCLHKRLKLQREVTEDLLRRIRTNEEDLGRWVEQVDDKLEEVHGNQQLLQRIQVAQGVVQLLTVISGDKTK
jgi:hypothetical protein